MNIKAPAVIILMAAAHRNYMPRKDDKFNDWQKNFIQYITNKLAAFGIAPINADWEALLDMQTDWINKFAAGNKFADRRRSQTVAKQKQRDIYERALRVFYRRYIASNAAVTNTDRAAMNVTIPDTVRTRSSLPQYAPLGSVSHIGHLFHKLRIVDARVTTKKAKPAGVRATRVYICVNDGTVDIKNEHFEFTGDTSAFEYTVNFQSADLGKTAHYYLVYENTHGETGPPGEVFSAVIA